MVETQNSGSPPSAPIVKTETGKGGGGKGTNDGKGDKGRSSTMSIPIAGLAPGAATGSLIDGVIAKMRDIITKPGGTFHELRTRMSELNDIQLQQIPVDLVCGAGYSDNVPYGLGTEVAVDFISSTEAQMTLGEANPHTRLTVRFGPEVYDFVARNANQIISFLEVPANQPITVNALLTLMSHACYRDSYMPGNLISLNVAGYILSVSGGQVKIANTCGKKGPVFLPPTFAGRSKLKQHLVKTVLTQEVPATAAEVGPPAMAAVPAYTAKNTVIAISIEDGTFIGDQIRAARVCFNQMGTNKNAANCQASKKFIYSIIYNAASKLFTTIPIIAGDIYNLSGVGDDGERSFGDMARAGVVPGDAGHPSLKRRRIGE